jgi:hypothetical protein
LNAPVLDLSALALRVRAGDVGDRAVQSGVGKSLRLVPLENNVLGPSRVLELSCPSKDMVEWRQPDFANTPSLVELMAVSSNTEFTRNLVNNRVSQLQRRLSLVESLLASLPSEKQLASSLLTSFKRLSIAIDATCGGLSPGGGEFSFTNTATIDDALNEFRGVGSNSLDALLGKFNSASGMSCPPLQAAIGNQCFDLNIIPKTRRRQALLDVNDLTKSINKFLPAFGMMAFQMAGGTENDVNNVCNIAKVTKDINPNVKKRDVEQVAPNAPPTQQFAQASFSIVNICQTFLAAKVKQGPAWINTKSALDVLCAGTQAQAAIILARASTVTATRQVRDSLAAAVGGLQIDAGALQRAVAKFNKCQVTYPPSYITAYNTLKSVVDACRAVSDAVVATGTMTPQGLMINPVNVPLELKVRAAQCKIDLVSLRAAALPMRPTVTPDCMAVLAPSFTCYRRVSYQFFATFPGTEQCDIIEGFRRSVEIYRGLVLSKCALSAQFCAVATSATATLLSVSPPNIPGQSEKPTVDNICSQLFKLRFDLPDSQVGANAEAFKAFMEGVFANNTAALTPFFEFHPVMNGVPADAVVGDGVEATEVQLPGVDLVDFGPIDQLTTAPPPETDPPRTRKGDGSRMTLSALVAAAMFLIVLCH